MLDLLPDSPTCSVDEAARALGTGRAVMYESIRQTGAVAGIPVIRVGRLVRVPTAPLRRLLEPEI
ncbi:MAG: DNA-binding protein [Actinomycetota bacterium]